MRSHFYGRADKKTEARRVGQSRMEQPNFPSIESVLQEEENFHLDDKTSPESWQQTSPRPIDTMRRLVTGSNQGLIGDLPNTDPGHDRSISNTYESNRMRLLKELMSPIFREAGDIQLLSEETLTFRIMALTLQCTTLADKFMQLLRYGTSERDALNPRAQTALAFRYASEYLSLKTRSNKSSSADPCGFQSKAFCPDLAEEAFNKIMNNKENIIYKPEKALFCEDQNYKPENKIEAGTSIPAPVKGNTKEEIQLIFEQKLREAQLQRDGSEKWGKQRDGHYSRWFVDLSSLGLSYQGQPVKSFELERSLFSTSKYPYLNMKLTMVNNQEYFYFSNNYTGKLHREIFALLSSSLSGKQCEVDTTTMKAYKRSDDFWQNKDRDWHFIERDRADYYGRIHPTIVRYAVSIIDHLRQHDKKKKVTILDIAGGNGDLGERLLKEIRRTFPGLQVTYRLVDYSQGDVTTANKRFGTLRTEYIDALAVTRNILIDYESNADKMKADQELGLPEDGADLIINSGGLLNDGIVDDPRVCIEINKMFSKLMSRRGFGIYSGLSPLLVNAEDHKRLGLEICNLFDRNIPSKQMHVVKHPS